MFPSAIFWDGPRAVSTPSTILNEANQGSSEEQLTPGLTQQRSKMSLEHLVTAESKETLKNGKDTSEGHGSRGFPGGPVVKTSPSSAEGANSTPGQGAKTPTPCG